MACNKKPEVKFPSLLPVEGWHTDVAAKAPAQSGLLGCLKSTEDGKGIRQSRGSVRESVGSAGPTGKLEGDVEQVSLKNCIAGPGMLQAAPRTEMKLMK